MSSELRPTTGAITGHALSNVFGSPFGLANELLGVEVGLVGGLQTLGSDRVARNEDKRWVPTHALSTAGGRVPLPSATGTNLSTPDKFIAVSPSIGPCRVMGCHKTCAADSPL